MPIEQKEQTSVEHQIIHPYGIGIDTHSKFIAVCVLANVKGTVQRTEKQFATTWPALLDAHAWALEVLARHLPKKTDPATLRYCIESTGTYHMPVLRAWRGIPSVVNPMLAGPTRRKTDVLDAQLLAHHSITGMWKPSFIASEQAQVLRVLWAQRREHARKATRSSNRINNILLRFGHTFGAEHSIRSSIGDGLVTALIEGKPVKAKGICPDGLPDSVKAVIAALQSDLEEATSAARAAQRQARDYIYANSWPTAADPLSGKALLDIFLTVPGVGETTAITWLAEVGDPRRFQLAKQVAAFSGCDPSVKVSAGKVTSHTRRAGNERLHGALIFAAQGLINRADEPLGQWARSIQGRHKKGGYKKGCGALARRIAAALWHVHRLGIAFSYDQYKLTQPLAYASTPLREILAPRPVKLLAEHGVKSSQQLGEAYTSGRLGTLPGFGESSLAAIRLWLQEHPPVRPRLTDPVQEPVQPKLKKRIYVLDKHRKFAKKGRKPEQDFTDKPVVYKTY